MKNSYQKPISHNLSLRRGYVYHLMHVISQGNMQLNAHLDAKVNVSSY